MPGATWFPCREGDKVVCGEAVGRGEKWVGSLRTIKKILDTYYGKQRCPGNRRISWQPRAGLGIRRVLRQRLAQCVNFPSGPRGAQAVPLARLGASKENTTEDNELETERYWQRRSKTWASKLMSEEEGGKDRRIGSDSRRVPHGCTHLGEGEAWPAGSTGDQCRELHVLRGLIFAVTCWGASRLGPARSGPPSPLPSHGPSLCALCSISFSYKGTSHIGSGPTLMTFFYLNYFCKYFISKHSYILSSWQLGLQHISFERTQFSS